MNEIANAIQTFQLPHRLAGAALGGDETKNVQPVAFANHFILQASALPALPVGFIELVNYEVRCLQSIYDMMVYNGSAFDKQHALRIVGKVIINITETWKRLFQPTNEEEDSRQLSNYISRMNFMILDSVASFYSEVLGCGREDFQEAAEKAAEKLNIRIPEDDSETE